jgi:prepilin-type processing-associated H-X9-DG protein
LRKIIAAVLSGIVFFPAFVRAQALSDRVPGDAMIYAGFTGIDAPGAGYDQSHLKAVVNESQLVPFLEQAIPHAFMLAGMTSPQMNLVLSNLANIGGPLLHHPSALYFGGIDISNPNQPIPRVAFLCDAGPDASALTDNFNSLIDRMRASNPACPAQCRNINNLVVISTFPYPDTIASPLSQNQDFQSRLSAMNKNPVVTFYADGVAINNMLNQIVQQMAPPESQARWPQIQQSIGFDCIKSIVSTCGFDQRDWSTQVLVESTPQRHGILFSSTSQPLSDDFFKMIPQSATSAAGGYCDLNSLFTAIHSAITQFAPDGGQAFDQGLSQVNSTLQMDVQADLLAAFGTHWAYYNDPSAVGMGVMGYTVINQPADPGKLEKSLGQLETALNNLSRQNIPPMVTLQFRQFQSHGVTVHYVSTPYITPAWAIKDGWWYAGLYPQVVEAALDRQAGSPSILDNAAFQSVRTRLGGPQQINSFAFDDLPNTVPQGYQAWLVLSRLYFGCFDLIGQPSPPLALPPLRDLLAEIEPAGAIAWSDDAGFHAKSISPFPGATSLDAGGAMQQGLAFGSAIDLSVLLPSLNRARETANRVKSASNLREIGQGILLYSNDHQGNYPPDLAILVSTENLEPQVFVAPNSGTQMPPGLTGNDLANWIDNNSDYTYAGAGLKMGAADPGTVVAYEKDQVNNNQGMNILFADGHVEWFPADQGHQIIQQGREVPPQPSPQQSPSPPAPGSGL